MTTLLGQRIRKHRKAKGLTLEQLAASTSSSKSYIWELENKQVPNPSGEKVARIAAVLEVTADYLLDSGPEPDAETATDQAFYRKYQQLDQQTKEKLRKMLDLLGDDK